MTTTELIISAFVVAIAVVAHRCTGSPASTIQAGVFS
ncbi:hypothetical protein ACVWZ8_000907 [Arthrobacter sp. UYCu723]